MSLETWLPPAVIIAVVVAFNTMLSKRIDDLRSQMSREHDTLAKKVDEVNLRLENLNQNFIEHLKSHL